MKKEKFSMDFLKENELEIIRNIKDPDLFIEDSFEVIEYPVNIKMIVGVQKDQTLLEGVLNPEKKCVQSVKFLKPDWDMESALEWLKENQKYFSDLKTLKKKVFKADLKSINGVEIFSAGTWNGDKYTVNDLDEMVKAFDETNKSIRPFLKLGHSDKQKLLEDEGLPAAGWIGKIYRKGEKLLADFIDIPNKIYELIENKAYRKVSSEVYIGVNIKDKKYKYLIGAVALLGAQTPGVMNLSDILARYGFKDYDKIKTYTDEKNDIQFKIYSFDEGDKNMSKTEKELQLELELKQLKEKLEGTEKENKKFKSDIDKINKTIEDLKEEKLEAEKKAFEMEKKAFETETEKQVDELISSHLISKAMKPFALAILRNEEDQETKKYSIKLEKEEKSFDRFELLKEFATLAQKTSDVNFDNNSEDGEKVDSKEEVDVEKYALENDLSYGDAYRQLYSGKLKVEKPHIIEE